MRGRALGTCIIYLTLNIANNVIPRIWSLDVYGMYNVIGGCTLYIQRELGVDVVYTTYILGFPQIGKHNFVNEQIGEP